MAPLLYLFLSIIIGIIVRAYALPIVLRVARFRHWLYVKFASEKSKEYSEEMLAVLPDEIALYRNEGDQNDVIAAKIFLHIVMELPVDIASWVPFIPNSFIDKIATWSDTLRHYRIPNAMIIGVATLGLMNYSFFSSHNNQTIGSWLLMNSTIVAITVLVWKIKHPLAYRIFNTWMGIAVVTSIVMMAWFTISHHLYEITTFKVLMLAMVSLLPAIIVVDKSWRNRLFRGRWWLIAICWVAVIAGSFAGTMIIAHDVKPLLEMWAVIGMLVIGMVIVYGTILLAVYILCWLGIRGGSHGLRLVAASIRRLR